MKEKAMVSVIIPSYNSINTIDKTLAGLEKQTMYDSITEIIIVDSSDDSKTHEFLQEYPNNKCKVIRSGYKVIPAIQRNIGARQASGNLLCFIDSDAIPTTTWVEKILEAYNNGYKVGGGSYLVAESQQNKPIAWAEYFLEFSQFINSSSSITKTNMVPSCNLFCSKQIFEFVGGFPEIRAAEDSHFGLRINTNNYMMTYHPEIKVYHIFRESKEHFLRNERMLGKFNFMYRKNSTNHILLKGIFPIIFIPVFMIGKFTIITCRVFQTNKHYIRKYFQAFPLILQGVFSWTKGQISGAKSFEENAFIN